MPAALAIIQDAYARLNRLSPGETLGPDEAAFAFARLGVLVDEIGGENELLFLDILTSAVQSGAITLGAGSWAAIRPGTEVISATANNLPMSKLTMQQYNELYQPTVTGQPTIWAQDGLNTVNLWPVPVAVTIKLQTRGSVAAFADQTTVYTIPDGWTAYLGAALAVRLAPSVLGAVPPDLLRAEKASKGGIDKYEPAVIDNFAYTGQRLYYPPRLF